MQSKYNKTIVLVGLFVIVLTVGILLKTDTGQGYLSWLKATTSNLIGIRVETPSDEGITDNIDLSNINIDANKDKATPVPNEQKTDSVAQNQPVLATNVALNVNPKPVDIEATVKDISEKVAQIDMEVKQMAINNEIQKQIDQIAIQVDKIGQEVNILRTGAQITEIQQKISVLSQQISLLTYQISASA